jgi:hypothetical protein
MQLDTRVFSLSISYVFQRRLRWRRLSISSGIGILWVTSCWSRKAEWRSRSGRWRARRSWRRLPRWSPLARPQRIVRRGGELVRYRPLNKFPPGLKNAPCKLFAKEAVNPRGLLAFVEKLRPLTRRGLKEEESDEVRPITAHALAMGRLLDARERAIKTRWRE